MSARAIKKQSIPWYREPWPWILMALPATAVVAGVVTLVIAIVYRDGLVAEDYYKQGLAINRVLEREARAAELGLTAQIMVSNKSMRLRMTGRGEFPDQVTVRFIHPTRAGEDQEIALNAIASGWYEGSMPELARGRWYLQLEDADVTWRLRGTWSTSQQSSKISARERS